MFSEEQLSKPDAIEIANDNDRESVLTQSHSAIAYLNTIKPLQSTDIKQFLIQCVIWIIQGLIKKYSE